MTVTEIGRSFVVKWGDRSFRVELLKADTVEQALYEITRTLQRPRLETSFPFVFEGRSYWAVKYPERTYFVEAERGEKRGHSVTQAATYDIFEVSPEGNLSRLDPKPVEILEACKRKEL